MSCNGSLKNLRILIKLVIATSKTLSNRRFDFKVKQPNRDLQLSRLTSVGNKAELTVNAFLLLLLTGLSS